MSAIARFLTSRWGPIITGVAVGILAPLLVFWGNPGNMGICVVCFILFCPQYQRYSGTLLLLISHYGTGHLVLQ